METEHRAVLDTMKVLEKQGFEVTYLPVREDGTVSLDLLKQSIRPETILVAAMLANNETGYLHPVKEMAAIARDRGLLFLRRRSGSWQNTGKCKRLGYRPVGAFRP